MGYEIDFLPVGEESKSGDAIALRYGNLYGPRGEQRVVVIDGGHADIGKEIVDHVITYYNTDRIDVVVSTHPDQDHVNGLKTVVMEMEVDQLWIHQPWKHSAAVSVAKSAGFRSGRFPERLEKSLAAASELEALAVAKGIPIVEPFTGLHLDGTFVVLGPSPEYYESLLSQFEDYKATAATRAITDLLSKLVEKTLKFVEEDLNLETLRDDGKTSPQNNSSVICLLQHQERACLLTADAGIDALSYAADALEYLGVAGKLRFVQVPHHGSRRNVGPTVLNRILGPKGQVGTHATAFVSSAIKGEPKHPSKKVTNAFRRRGYKVFATQGSTKHHFHQASDRGWSSATPLPFYTQVEEDED